ncbi:MAG: winged helix-turn-helix transcriptional regulator [Methanobacteriaceae archaeon]|jgi:putative transcriptional regulator|nr:winged helix-turn-helix transcriptional regulator [Methanobacteriaceae archaeon]
MQTFKRRGTLTHFQILSEIAKQDYHLKQKDLAETLGVTIQAVSENIKTLIEEGYITSKDGRSPYTITQLGIDRVKKEAVDLRKFTDEVLDTMSAYKTVWPAIAADNLKKDEKVGLYMDRGILYAGHDPKKAMGTVLEDTEKGRDVALGSLTGTIDFDIGKVTIITLPTIKEGGSKTVNLDLVKETYDKLKSDELKVAVIGTISHAVANMLDIPIDIEHAAAQATANAARKGLNILVLTVGDMTKSFIRELDDEKIKYDTINGKNN